MRILHIGNGNERHRGKRFYDVGRKIHHGLIRNLHNVLLFSDRDTARQCNIFGSSRSKSGIRKANERLIELTENFQPEFFLFDHADLISAETVKTMRAMFPQAKAAQFNVDPVFMEGTVKNIQRKLDLMDATFVTTGGTILKKFSRPGKIVAYMPNPVDGSIENYRCHTRSDQPFDMFYAVRATTTTGDYRNNYRLDLPRELAHAIPEMRCDYHGFDGKPEIFGVDFYEALGRCKMGLNLSHRQTTKAPITLATSEEKYLYSSDRISQYLGNGLLTFTHSDNHLERLFGEDEIVFFDDPADLAEKIRYFLTHDMERKRIAGKGWNKAHQLHNERLVAQYIVETTMGEGLSRDYAWPTDIF